jgi:hypothetical protein
VESASSQLSNGILVGLLVYVVMDKKPFRLKAVSFKKRHGPKKVYKSKVGISTWIQKGNYFLRGSTEMFFSKKRAT